MRAATAHHQPVLAAAVVELLRPCLDGLIVDGTAGLGGHTTALLTAGAQRMLALDLDPEAARLLSERMRAEARVRVLHASFADLGAHVPAGGAAGVVLDLGVSSLQLDTAARGFSFRLDGPIDMRFDPTSGAPAAQIVNRMPEPELAALLRTLGEERRARAVARRIAAARPLHSTAALARVVAGAFAGRQRRHPATRTFQALRMAANAELETLRQGLDAARLALRGGGRLAAIAFHSLEDREVKQTFNAWAGAGLGRVVTRRPIRPERAETQSNPRARSARLRGFEVDSGVDPHPNHLPRREWGPEEPSGWDASHAPDHLPRRERGPEEPTGWDASHAPDHLPRRERGSQEPRGSRGPSELRGSNGSRESRGPRGPGES